MNDTDPEVLDPREAFTATSPWFGAMVCPAVVVIGKDGDDGNIDSEPEVA